MTAAVKPKLTQISASTDMKLGGPSSVVINSHYLLARAFQDYKLIVFGRSTTDDLSVFRVKTIFNNRFGLIINICNLKIIRRIRKSDVILIHGYYLFSTIFSIALFPGKQIFLMPHGTFENYQKSRHRLRKSFFSFLLKIFLNNRKIHFMTASESEVIPIRESFPNNKISVVGLGVNIPIVDGLHEQSKNVIRLVFIGRIADKKRIDLCIRCVNLLSLDGYDITLRIIGAGSSVLKQNLLNLITELKLNQKIEFLDHMETAEILIELLKADVFLLPSENENFAVAVAESIAALVPVVVSKNVSMHTFVDRHNTGITISDLSSNLLRDAILQIMQNHAHYRDNCRISRNLLSWDQVIDNWIEVLLRDVTKDIL